MLSHLKSETVVGYDQYLYKYMTGEERIWRFLPPVEIIFSLSKCYTFKPPNTIEWTPEEEGPLPSIYKQVRAKISVTTTYVCMLVNSPANTPDAFSFPS